MQELMDYLNEDEFTGICDIRDRIEELLEKEKEQIIDAYYGNIDGVYGYREAGEQYYNQTYKLNK